MSQPSLNLNSKAEKVIDSIKCIIDKHAAIKLASKSKVKQMSKPWLRGGFLKSIKTKQKMYRSHFEVSIPCVYINIRNMQI
jgi:hypothetical protein